MEQVHSWLISQHVHVPKDWLTACLEWLQEENQGGTSQNQRQQVLEQWLLTDLEELSVARLPRKIMDEKFCLQINTIMDVSKPLYGQLLEFQNRDNPNTRVSAETQITQKPWEAKPTRMLKMTLTDGVTEVVGMEYRSISCLNDKLPPGTKVKIKGPVTCKKGMLMLAPSNVQLLGGEVEDLFERNSKEALLCRAFNQQPVPQSNQQPQPIQNRDIIGLPVEATSHTVQGSVNSGFQTGANANHENINRNESTSMSDNFGDELTDDDILLEMERIESQQANNPTATPELKPILPQSTTKTCGISNTKVKQAHHHNKVMVNDCRITSVSQNAVTGGKRQNNKTSKQISIEDAFKQNFKPLSENLAKYANADPGRGGASHNRQATVKPSYTKTSLIKREIKQEDEESCPPLIARIQKAPINNACLTSPDCSAMEDDELVELAKFVEETEQPTVNYICQLSSSNKVVRRLSVKAFIVTLLSKLHGDATNGWNLKAKICDGTGTFDVQFNDTVLTQLIGFKARQVEAIKRRSDPDDLNKLRLGMRNCRDTIIGMCKIMTLDLSGEVATVTALTDADDKYWSDLQTRVDCT